MSNAFTFFNCVNFSYLNSLIQGVSPITQTIRTRVQQIAHIGVSAILFYLQPNLFALGFVAGFIFDKQVEKIVKKVDMVFQAKRGLLENLFLFGGGAILAILTLPTTLVIANAYYSSQWGAALYRNSLPVNTKTTPPKPSTP